MLLNPLRRAVREHQGFPILPGGFPLVGHVPAIVRDLPALLDKASREVGSHFWLDFGFTGMELTCLLPDSATLLRNKATTSKALESLAPDILTDVMLAQDGERHRTLRAGMNGPFQFAGLTATGLGPVLGGMIGRRVERWRDQAQVKLMPEARDLILSLIFRIMGIEDTAFADWRRNYGRFTMLMIAPPIDLPGMPRPRGRHARGWIDDRLRGFIHDARQAGAAGTLLAAIVQAFDSDRAGLADTHLIANLRFMILAGHETTAATIAWAVVELARRPAVWDALCQEAEAAGSVPQTPKDLAQFPYAEALFRETLRHHPAITLSKRRALVDFELGGRIVPAGANLCVPFIAWSRHPDLHDRSDEFVVERWLGAREAVRPLETLQFGGGPHFCLGYHLAWLEVVQFCVALALIMGREKRRPKVLAGDGVCRTYFPIAHPPSSLRVGFGPS